MNYDISSEETNINEALCTKLFTVGKGEETRRSWQLFFLDAVYLGVTCYEDTLVPHTKD